MSAATYYHKSTTLEFKIKFKFTFFAQKKYITIVISFIMCMNIEIKDLKNKIDIETEKLYFSFLKNEFKTLPLLLYMIPI